RAGLPRVRPAGNARARGKAQLLENLAAGLEPHPMAARFPNRSGSETAANGRAAGGERGPITRDGSAQPLAAASGRDRGAVRFRREDPGAQDNPRFRTTAPRTLAIDPADAGRAYSRQSRRGAVDENVSRHGSVAAP